MKTLKEIVDEGLVDTIRVDSTLDERYGDEPLFPHKIERIKSLLKGTKLDSTLSKPKAASSKSPRRIS